MEAATAAFIVLCLSPLAARSRGAGQSAAPSRPTVSAVRVDQPPTIDGRLDEDLWRRAAHLDRFVQERPVEGAQATESTDVYVAYDSERIYVGIHAHYSDAGLVRANRVDRDQIANDDSVTLFFDPFLDHLRGYAFSVNGYGVQRDALIGERDAANDPDGDATWNALYSSAGNLVEDGWTAELAIPFKSLRYPSRAAEEPHRWGFQIQREIRTKNERVSWAPIRNNVMGFLPQMGVLDGMTRLSTRRNLELLPTVTAVQQSRLSSTGTFARAGIGEVGIGVKFGVTSNLTLDFTANPDFSQIESDRPQIEVNQRFPLLYPELRPFFLEGAEIFRIQGAITYAHTRTIVDPQYGVKLTGKVGKTTLGVLMTNDEAPGKVDDPRDPGFGRTAHSAIVRAKHDLYPNSYVGAMVSDREFLGRSSRLALVDGQFRLGASHNFGIRAVRTDWQERAGVRHTGVAVDAGFRRDSNRHLNYQAIHFLISPDWKSDLSFVNRVDQRRSIAGVGYRWWPGNWIVNCAPRLNVSQVHNWARTLTDRQADFTGDVQFARNVSVNANVLRALERYREIDFYKTRFSVTSTVNTNRNVMVTAKIDQGDQIRFSADPYLGRTTVYSLGLTLRPLSRVQALVNLDTTKFTDVRTDTEVFDVKILHTVTTYQFTDRLLVRNIIDVNTLDKTLGANVLVTYRVNAGTVFFIGYDDRYRRGDMLTFVNSPARFPADYRPTNRAAFLKLQYLYRR